MMAAQAGLVLEGGGLRGVYTSGVLRFFMDRQLYFPYVIGVSMGACNAANYVSRQPERNRIVNIRFVTDSRYVSYFRLLTRGELFGMDFIFDTIPNRLVPFDFKTFMESPQKCVTVVTDCETGKPRYYEKKELAEEYLTVLRASVSLPFAARPVCYRGHPLMDGGVSDSIPIRKSLADDNRKNVLVLTRPRGYRKNGRGVMRLARIRYPRYAGLCEALQNRHVRYNETLDFIEALEKQRKIFVIRPDRTLAVGRAERNREKLYRAYDQGYADAANQYPALGAYLKGEQKCRTIEER